jgi:hypothetical protein
MHQSSNHTWSSHPIGDDHEEPVYEEEDTQFVEEGKWSSPLCMFSF